MSTMPAERKQAPHQTTRTEADGTRSDACPQHTMRCRTERAAGTGAHTHLQTHTLLLLATHARRTAGSVVTLFTASHRAGPIGALLASGSPHTLTTIPPTLWTVACCYSCCQPGPDCSSHHVCVSGRSHGGNEGIIGHMAHGWSRQGRSLPLHGQGADDRGHWPGR